MQKIMKNKGITLVALVVTIVIMLILAGVTLNIALGDNGLFKMATQSVDKYKEASEEEQRQMAMVEAATNTKNTVFQGVTIPAGFAPTRIEGESKVDDGLVIIDADGNEFVWIPVRDEEAYRRNNSYENYEFAKADTDYLPNDLVKNNDSDEEKIERELVVKAGGFYIGRYEAGVDGDISIIDEVRGNSLFLEW